MGIRFEASPMLALISRSPVAGMVETVASTLLLLGCGGCVSSLLQAANPMSAKVTKHRNITVNEEKTVFIASLSHV